MPNAPLPMGIQRAGEWLESETARRVYEALKADVPLSQIGRDELARAAIDRYQPHIINAMQRAGLDVPDGELTPDALADAIGRALDLDLPVLTPDAIADALDRRMAREVSARLGVDLTTLRDPQAIKDACQQAVISAIRSGKANALISRAKIGKFRQLAAWAQAGIAPNDRRAWLNRWYQKKWRRTHRQVWDKLGHSGNGWP